jgi:hypothetical protein
VSEYTVLSLTVAVKLMFNKLTISLATDDCDESSTLAPAGGGG